MNSLHQSPHLSIRLTDDTNTRIANHSISSPMKRLRDIRRLTLPARSTLVLNRHVIQITRRRRLSLIRLVSTSSTPNILTMNTHLTTRTQQPTSMTSQRQINKRSLIQVRNNRQCLNNPSRMRIIHLSTMRILNNLTRRTNTLRNPQASRGKQRSKSRTINNHLNRHRIRRHRFGRHA